MVIVCKFKKTVDGREGHREWNTQRWPNASKKGLVFGKICFHPSAGFAQDSVAATVSAIETVLSLATALSVMSNAADVTVDFLEKQFLREHFLTALFPRSTGVRSEYEATPIAV